LNEARRVAKGAEEETARPKDVRRSDGTHGYRNQEEAAVQYYIAHGLGKLKESLGM
jgi:hypothetical protein